MARFTPSAINRGRELAMREEHRHQLETAYEVARSSGCSPISVAMRVLDADRRVFFHGVRINENEVERAARRAVERALIPRDTEFLNAVKKEMFDLMKVAGDAYRTARDDIGASKRREKANRQKANEDLLAELLGKKRKKERARFDAKLRRLRKKDPVLRRAS